MTDPQPQPIRKGLLPATPPPEWQFSSVFATGPDSEPGLLLIPGDAGPVVVRRSVAYGDWNPVRPDHWAPEPPAGAPIAATTPAAAPTAALRDRLDAAIDGVFDRWKTGLGDQTPQDAIRAAVMAVLPAPADRATVLREAADALPEADLRLVPPMDRKRVANWLRRLADAASGPGGAAGETQQDETQAEAHPPAVTWQIESPRRDTWTRWSGTRDTAEEAREDYDRAVGWGGERRAYRLVEAATTYTVVAEHQPAAVSQPGKEAETAHACTEFDVWFDRNVCPDPCGAMHQRCDQCGAPIGGCANGNPASDEETGR